jgi:hypothetical protein
MVFTLKNSKNKRPFLMDRNYIVARRATYFRRILKEDGLGSNRNLCTWTVRGITRRAHSKCWQDSKTESVMKNDRAGQRWITVHARRGGGLFQGHTWFLNQSQRAGTTTTKLISKFFSKPEILVPSLWPECIIVLDNAPYHSVQMNKPLNLASKKSRNSWMVWEK